MPVPDAPMTPTGPRLTTLAKQSGMPLMMAVPQSGPITNKPLRRPSALRAISSSSETLSENSMTCRPLSSAWRASRAA